MFPLIRYVKDTISPAPYETKCLSWVFSDHPSIMQAANRHEGQFVYIDELSRKTI